MRPGNLVGELELVTLVVHTKRSVRSKTIEARKGDLRKVVHPWGQIRNTHLRIRVRVRLICHRNQTLIGDSGFVDQIIREKGGESQNRRVICFFGTHRKTRQDV